MSGKRHVIISDVHGCWFELQALLALIKFDPNNDVGILNGDLCDRGPDSAKCIEIAMDNRFVLIGSNHDVRLLNWKTSEELVATRAISRNEVKLRSTHKRSIDEIEAHPRSNELWTYLKNFLPVYEFRAGKTVYNCVHAGYLPNLGRMTPERWLFRVREVSPNLEPVKSRKLESSDTFWAKIWAGPQKVIFGHTVFDHPTHYQYAVGIDTGCCFGNKLTAMTVSPDGKEEFFSVQAAKPYANKVADES